MSGSSAAHLGQACSASMVCGGASARSSPSTTASRSAAGRPIRTAASS